VSDNEDKSPSLDPLANLIDACSRYKTEAEQLKAALDLAEGDPHQFSSRPCTTCGTIARLTGKPFGCTKMKK
jgi:hypothetical protein